MDSLSEVFPSHGARVHGHGSHGFNGHMKDNADIDTGPDHHEGHAEEEVSDVDHKGEHGNMMSMAFHVGDTETILFDFWRTKSAWAIGLSCLVIFLVAVLYEGLKFYREWLFENRKRRLEGGRDQYGPPRRYREQNHNYNQPTYPYRLPPPAQQTQGQTQMYAYYPAPPSMPHIPPIPPGEVHVPHIREPNPEPGEKVPWRKRLCSRMHIYQTFLHVLQVFISFLLMLVFMTFNVWLCVAVLLGAGVGYFIFCAFSTRINEHCN